MSNAAAKMGVTEGWAVRDVPADEPAHMLSTGRTLCPLGPPPLPYDVPLRWRPAREGDRRCSACRGAHHRQRHQQIEAEGPSHAAETAYRLFAKKATDARRVLPLGRIVCIAREHGTTVDAIRAGADVPDRVQAKVADLLRASGFTMTDVGAWMSINRRTVRKMTEGR